MRRFTELAYDDLEPGLLGRSEHTLAEGDIARWRRIIEDDAQGGVPMSYALTWFLEALRQGLQGIPSGGVLARHELRFGRQPTPQAVLDTTMEVDERYEKRGHDYVAFRFTTTEQSAFVAEDVMHLIWPGPDGELAVKPRSAPPANAPPVEGDVLIEGRITQARIDDYADLSQDYNPLHCDPEAGRASPFGSTIAHGPIPLGYVFRGVARLHGDDWVDGLAVDARFVGPSRPGDRLRVVRTAPLRLAAVRHDGLTAIVVQLSSGGTP